ncbi:MAG: EAL domain-containing protein [Pseudomonadota bacterium]|nr:EAL domain-containing protein [Pseudomonadota bacterium]
MDGVRSSWWEKVRGRWKQYPRLRLFMWVAFLGLMFGAIDFGEPLEDGMRATRNALHQRQPSGDIVVVAIDDRSLVGLEKWPWPRRYHAQLAENLHRLGAKRIIFDIDFSRKSNPRDDHILAQTFARLGKKVTLPVQVVTDSISDSRTELHPVAQFGTHVSLANVNVRYNWRGTVWSLPYGVRMQRAEYPSLASLMAGRAGQAGTWFPIDYSVAPRSVPMVSALDVIRGNTSAAAIAGKDVIIGTTSRELGDTFARPAGGLISGVYLHVLGAETLKAGTPTELGWLPAFVLALIVAGGSLRLQDMRASIAAAAVGATTLLALPFAVEAHLIYIDIVPGLFVLVVLGCVDSWRKFRHSYRSRGNVNALSGLPNLNALREEKLEHDRPLIAARVQNYPEITSALPPEDEKALIEQIAARLTLVASQSKLYQGDEGIFAWFAEPAPLADHLDALHALFRSPVRVAGNSLDLTITFGIDAGSDRSVANRLGSALVAADEAAAEGLRWKEYDPAKLKDAAWKLSLLSQLDAAIDSGALWVAYQPKLDLRTGSIIGAEALVRWTHPDKGPISPIEFIIAAEQSDRIEKLTHYVLDQAIARAAALNARGAEFGMSVNLSARLVDDPQLVAVVKDLLRKHRLPAACLTLEVTETVALTGSGNNFQTLHDLRRLGVQLSIDDYGTGLSTLDYLKKVPATEIKIDKGFVQAVGNSRGDMLMVHSTIQLAHSLGHKVVAEGVEEAETLELLRKMGCDVAQGYLIGRPMTFRALSRQVLAKLREDAA